MGTTYYMPRQTVFERESTTLHSTNKFFAKRKKAYRHYGKGKTDK